MKISTFGQSFVNLKTQTAKLKLTTRRRRVREQNTRGSPLGKITFCGRFQCKQLIEAMRGAEICEATAYQTLLSIRKACKQIFTPDFSRLRSRRRRRRCPFTHNRCRCRSLPIRGESTPELGRQCRYPGNIYLVRLAVVADCLNFKIGVSILGFRFTFFIILIKN